MHLLKNADANARANSILCKTINGPLSSLITAASALTHSSLASGGATGILGGRGGSLTGLLSKAGTAGVPVTPAEAGPARVPDNIPQPGD